MTSALHFALRKLSRRAMHSQRLYTLMEEAGFDEKECSQALLYLREKGFLDDESYSASFVQGWQKRGKSRRQILEKAKVQCMDVGELATHFGDEKQVLEELIAKRYSLLLQKNGSYIDKQKAIQSLMRRGFSYHTIVEILSTNSV